MARFETKGQLIEQIETDRQKLEKTVAALDETQMTQPGVCGEWSIKDILAHLVEWEQMLLGWYRAGLRGEVPKTPAPDLNWGQLSILNQRIYEKHRDRPLTEILADFRASYQETLETVGVMAEEDLFKHGRYAWLRTSALVSYIAPCTCSHYRWANTLIRKWLKAQANPKTGG
jgi:uncharacterized protein (TIGR03083 family)